MSNRLTFQSVMERLEDRVLFDAVPDGGFLIQPELDSNPPVAQVQEVDSAQASPPELILVDDSVENLDEMLDEILKNQGDRSFEIHFLNSNQDGIDQITDLLASSDAKFEAIHILSHGSDGNLSLGNTSLNSTSIGAYSEAIGGWANNLNANADILLYGCHLAESDHGQMFIQKLSAMSGADVAASTDVTGSEELSGDWDLEYDTGVIEVLSLELTMWDGKLESPTAFTGSDGMFQMYSKYGQLAEIDLANQSFTDAASRADEKVNAVGYRNADNFAYGILVGTGEVGRIGQNGVVENLGAVAGLPTNQGSMYVGDFAEDDLLYVRNNNERNKLYGINVDTMTVDNIITTSTTLNNIHDIAYNNADDVFYAVQRGTENVLLSIATDGTVNTIGNVGVGKLTFGAMYADSTGKVYGGANQTGEIFQLDTSTGQGTRVGKANKSGINDGFSNAFVELEMPAYAADDDFTVGPDEIISGNLFNDNGNGGDVDANGDSFTVVNATDRSGDSGMSSLLLDSGAIVNVDANGNFTYDCNGQFDDLVVGQTFEDSFTYTIEDSEGNQSTATCTVVIEGTYEKENEAMAGVEIMDPTQDVTNLTNIHEEFKTTVMAAGDFNGDGYEDAIVGDAGANEEGAAYVVYGSATGHANNFDVTTLLSANGGDGSRGVVFHGVDIDDRAGASVSSAGDINGDGIADIIIGATDVDVNGNANAGAAYVVFGGQNLGAEFDLANLTAAGGGDGSQGFVIKGVAANDLFGGTVGSVGDINNDGVGDVAIAAQHADVDGRKNTGQTFVVFGSNSGFHAEMNASDLLSANGGDGSDGFVINGINAHDLLADRIVGGSDVNGDGIDDMLLSAVYADANGLVDAGQSYVIYGSGSGFGAELNLGDLLEANGGDGSIGLVINGGYKQTGSGAYVSFGSDANNDNIDELVMGVGNPEGGSSYIVNGGSDKMSGAELDQIKLKEAGVYADNFDTANANYDLRSWDKFSNNVTLHSTEGTRVTIWGDPHVEVDLDGVRQVYDIGYGAGSIPLSTGSVISWATYAHDPAEFPLGPPLEYFNIDTAGTSNDKTFDTADGTLVVDDRTALTEEELREFIEELAKYAGLATEPLTYNG